MLDQITAGTIVEYMTDGSIRQAKCIRKIHDGAWLAKGLKGETIINDSNLLRIITIHGKTKAYGN